MKKLIITIALSVASGSGFAADSLYAEGGSVLHSIDAPAVSSPGFVDDAGSYGEGASVLSLASRSQAASAPGASFTADAGSYGEGASVLSLIGQSGSVRDIACNRDGRFTDHC